MIKIAPSILAADPLNLEREVLRVEQSGCDWLHIDVMDAHFVPNLAYGPDVVRSLKRVTRLPLDVHLMMDHPERWKPSWMPERTALPFMPKLITPSARFCAGFVSAVYGPALP